MLIEFWWKNATNNKKFEFSAAHVLLPHKCIGEWRWPYSRQNYNNNTKHCYVYIDIDL